MTDDQTNLDDLQSGDSSDGGAGLQVSDEHSPDTRPGVDNSGSYDPTAHNDLKNKIKGRAPAVDQAGRYPPRRGVQPVAGT